MLPAATASLLALISRSTSRGPISAIAASQASATPATASPKRAIRLRGLFARLERELSAARRNQDAGGEEEDGAQRRDLPEPVEAGADREGEHRGE